MQTILPNHLGGHCNITHIDEDTLDYLINRYSISSMYDVGCGPGGMVKLAQSKGLTVTGIDGDFTITYPKDLNVIIHDFTTGPLNLPPVDLVWTCEFLEHVAEEYMNNYFAVFTQSKVVCCTFSLSRGGYHHVNVKNQSYWDNQFQSRGFIKDLDATMYIRSHSSMSRNFIRNTGTVYTNSKYL